MPDYPRLPLFSSSFTNNDGKAHAPLWYDGAHLFLRFDKIILDIYWLMDESGQNYAVEKWVGLDGERNHCYLVRNEGNVKVTDTTIRLQEVMVLKDFGIRDA